VHVLDAAGGQLEHLDRVSPERIRCPMSRQIPASSPRAGARRPPAPGWCCRTALHARRSLGGRTRAGPSRSSGGGAPTTRTSAAPSSPTSTARALAAVLGRRHLIMSAIDERSTPTDRGTVLSNSSGRTSSTRSARSSTCGAATSCAWRCSAVRQHHPGAGGRRAPARGLGGRICLEHRAPDPLGGRPDRGARAGRRPHPARAPERPRSGAGQAGARTRRGLQTKRSASASSSRSARAWRKSIASSKAAQHEVPRVVHAQAGDQACLLPKTGLSAASAARSKYLLPLLS